MELIAPECMNEQLLEQHKITHFTDALLYLIVWMAEKNVAIRETRIVESLRPISNFGCPVCSHDRCEIFHRRKGIIVDG